MRLTTQTVFFWLHFFIFINIQIFFWWVLTWNYCNKKIFVVCWKMFWKVNEKKTMWSSTNQGKLYQEIVSIGNIFLILIPIFLLLLWFVFHTWSIWTILCSLLFFLAWIANRNYQICLELKKHGQHVLLVENVRFLVVSFELFLL